MKGKCDCGIFAAVVMELALALSQLAVCIRMLSLKTSRYICVVKIV